MVVALCSTIRFSHQFWRKATGGIGYFEKLEVANSHFLVSYKSIDKSYIAVFKLTVASVTSTLD